MFLKVKETDTSSKQVPVHIRQSDSWHHSGSETNSLSHSVVSHKIALTALTTNSFDKITHTRNIKVLCQQIPFIPDVKSIRNIPEIWVKVLAYSIRRCNGCLAGPDIHASTTAFTCPSPSLLWRTNDSKQSEATTDKTQPTHGNTCALWTLVLIYFRLLTLLSFCLTQPAKWFTTHPFPTDSRSTYGHWKSSHTFTIDSCQWT